MYRQHLKKMTSVDNAGDSADPQFFSRIYSIPLVMTAYGQVSAIYQQTKDSSTLLRYTLESAETGVKTVTDTAMPLVHKFDKPLKALDNLACSQIDTLSEKYPVINKPTQEVYDSTLKPVVDYSMDKVNTAKDTISSVKDYSVNTVSSVKDYSVNTVTSVKDYSVNTVTSVKDYGVNTITSVKDYSAEKVGNVKSYTCTKLGDLTQYSCDKLVAALDTPYGQVASKQVDGWLDSAEKYMDLYLPEDCQDGECEKHDLEKSSATPLHRACSLSNKARQRMYTRALQNLKHAQVRTQETLDKLHFTVDLIQYSKTNIENVTGAMTTKLNKVWTEINASEEEAEKLALDADDATTTTTTAILERRAIATARHLTLKLKTTVNALNTHMHVLPKSFSDRSATLKKYTNDLYNSFSSIQNVRELPQQVLTQTTERLSYLMETASFIADYLQNTPLLNWMGLQPTKPAVDEIQMEALPAAEKSEQDKEESEKAD